MLARDLEIGHFIYSCPEDPYDDDMEFYSVYATNETNIFLQVFDNIDILPKLITRKDIQRFLDDEDDDARDRLDIEEIKALISLGFDLSDIVADLVTFTQLCSGDEEE